MNTQRIKELAALTDGELARKLLIQEFGNDSETHWVLKSEGNSLLDIIPVPYWLTTSCSTNFLGAFYFVNRYGDAEKCLAGLSYCTIRLVFELKQH